jgi:hypothetical protein
MLDRILNINPQEKYKSGLKIPSSNYFAINRYEQEKHNSKDSALFSPLAKLLSKINWKILNVEYPSNEEILFHFLVDDLEFITVIDLGEINKEPYQVFTIYRHSKNLGKNLQYKIKLKSEKDEIGILNKADPIRTENITKLFDRCSEITNGNNYTINEPNILEEFVSGIKNAVNVELNYILKVIYTFISTRNRSKIKNKINLKTQKNIPIIMLKVVINNAEKLEK